MTKKKQKSPEWLLPAIIVGIIVVIWVATSIDTSSSYQNIERTITKDVNNVNTNTYCYNGDCYQTQQEYQQAVYDYELDEVNEEHGKYLDIVEKERSEARESLECFDSWESELELSNCISNSRIILNKYESKLKDLRVFLQQRGGIFNNQLKLISSADDSLAEVYQAEASIENFVVQYNARVETLQNQQELSQAREEAFYDAIGLLSGLPI